MTEWAGNYLGNPITVGEYIARRRAGVRKYAATAPDPNCVPIDPAENQFVVVRRDGVWLVHHDIMDFREATFVYEGPDGAAEAISLARRLQAQWTGSRLILPALELVAAAEAEVNKPAARCRAAAV